MKVCVLASGSSGNCTYVASERTAILVDAGLSGKATAQRLAQIGVPLERVEAICVTHEHSDHTAGLAVLGKSGRIRLYANSGTVSGLEPKLKDRALAWNIFATGAEFAIGDLILNPFTVPHDAYDPVGYIIRCGETRVGVVTDMGMATGLIRERLRVCSALVLESNHDEQLLKEADRPWHLKQRISGRQGHLSNQHAAQLLAEIAGPSLQAVFLAHLSSECNNPGLARQTAEAALTAAGHAAVRILVASADSVSDVWEG